VLLSHFSSVLTNFYYNQIRRDVIGIFFFLEMGFLGTAALLRGETITLRLLHGRLTAPQSLAHPLRQILPATASVLRFPSGNSPFTTV